MLGIQNIDIEPFEIPPPAYVLETSGKVHAEIQLLFYYELYPERPRSRIICAISSSTSMEASTFLELTAGSMTNGSYQTG